MIFEQAFTPNKINKSKLLPLFRSSLAETLQDFLAGKKISYLESRGDYYVVHSYEFFYLCSTKEPFPIGFIQMETQYMVHASFVLPKYQGKGLGLFLYEVALKKLGQLFSSTDLSKGSSALWRTLVTKYNGVLVLDKHLIDRPKDIELKVQGWQVVKGITYPVFNTVKGERNLSNLFKLFNRKSSSAAKESYYKITAK